MKSSSRLRSQTASQGLRAGYVTLLGSASALLLIAAAAVFGLTSILVAVPSLYLALAFDRRWP